MQAQTVVLDRLKGQLAQIDALIKDGVLTGDAARQARDDLERQLLAAVLNPAAAAAGAATAPTEPRPPRRLVLAVSAFVLAVGVVGYAALGSHEGLRVEPGMAGPPGAEAADAHAPDSAQVEGMIAKLAERLKSQPDDAEGWAMLGRSYAAQGRHTEALPAFKRVVDLKPKDAQALADYADALAVINNRSLEGEPEKLILQAVQLDPTNVKALALAGTVAFNRGQYNDAATLWERAVRDADPQAEYVKTLQGAIAEAKQRAGGPATAATTGAATSKPAPAGAAVSAAVVAGRVTLKPALRAQAAPDDTVFIFARAPTGSRMPLAILRRKVSDLPLDFSLDDSLAMSPAMTLSSAKTVVVGVRISKSGNAVPAPGDLQALSAPVPVGTRGIQLEIAEQLK